MGVWGKGRGKPFGKGSPSSLPPDPHPISLPKLFVGAFARAAG